MSSPILVIGALGNVGAEGGEVGVNVTVGVNVSVGDGVGVGGTGYSARLEVFPVTVAYCPHNQQVPDPLTRLITQ